MPEQLEILRMAQSMAQHAARRQAVIARNIAHADTPGFKAQDIGSFADTYEAASTDRMRITRSGHLGGAEPPGVAAAVLTRPGAADPNGNSVSLEAEMVHAVEAQRAHNRALTVYSKSLDILRMSLGRIR